MGSHNNFMENTRETSTVGCHWTVGSGGMCKAGFPVRKINENQPELEERHDFFVSGLGQTETIDAARECNTPKMWC